jgi:hypothetical protein
MKIFPKKDPGEKFWIEFDYADEMEASETISSASLSIEVVNGTDASPSSVLSGAMVNQSTNMAQLIQGGLSGCIYAFKCLATTSLGRVLARAARLPVQNAKDW